MPPLNAIAPRLAKLLPLLSSDQPGEVAATVAAIGRTLAGAGATWHDLAAVLTTTTAVTPSPPREQTRSGRAREFGRMLDELADCRAGTLTRWEAQFLTNISGYWMKGKPLSDRQAACLRGIHARVFGDA